VCPLCWGAGLTWLRWYAGHVRYVLRGAGLYLRDGDEAALTMRIEVSAERNPFRRAVKASTLVMHEIGEVFRSLAPVLKRTVDAVTELQEKLREAA
jgi:hypothetical protein